MAREARKDEALRKTQLCKDFQNGRCSYGDRCFFAHSAEELRPAPPQQPRKAGNRWNGPMDFGLRSFSS